MLNIEDSLLADSNPSKKIACARFYHEVVSDHTGGTAHIKPGMQIPFTCSVHERVLLHMGEEADIAEKTVTEEKTKSENGY